MKDIICYGLSLVDYFVEVNDISEIGDLEYEKHSTQEINSLEEFSGSLLESFCPGGSATNTAISSSLIGLESAYIGIIGNDGIGNGFESRLNNYGVETFLSKDYSLGTGFIVTVIEKGSEDSDTFTSFYNYGVNKNFCFDEFKKEISDCKFFYTTFYPVLAGVDLEEIISYASKKCDKVVMDFGGVRFINRIDKVMDLVEDYSDIIFSNKVETECLEDYSGKGHDNLFDNPEIQIFKKGCNGSIVRNRELYVQIPVVEVDVKNSVGAGDTYSAGFLWGLLNNKSIVDSATYASYLAAIVVGSEKSHLTEEMNYFDSL